MERKFYTDNFEQLLRETTDEFRMYPSRRVWHSLYNGLHPARKWPSLAVLLLLITSIMYIGVSNSNDVTALTAKNEQPISTSENMKGAVADNPGSSGPTSLQISRSSNLLAGSTFAETNSSYTGSTLSSGERTNTSGASVFNKRAATSTAIENIQSESAEYQYATYYADISSVNAQLMESELNYTASPNLVLTDEQNVSKANQEELDEKAWIEDFVFQNKRNNRKFRDKIVYQFYTTPSVGFRTISNTEYTPPPTSLIDGQVSMENAFNHTRALNMEAGGNILYSFSKNLRLKAGVQLNYTNYKVNAYELNHPTATTVTMNDFTTGNNVLEAHNTTLANTPGLYTKNLNNNTYQLSVPLGADIKLAGNNKIKWYAGATVQPTFVAGGNAYLISSDLKNYVADNNMMRKFNLNGGIETFVSYKTKNGIILNAGPQLRYQFLSTYVKQYTFDEKLYNIGLKLGITTNF